MKPISEKERRFIDAYMGEAAGNGTAAAKCAGYKGSANVLKVQANRLLTKATVQATIAERRATLQDIGIADQKERRELLTRYARTAPEDDRQTAIRAIDVLNKMDGLYLTKLADPDGQPLRIEVGWVGVIWQQPRLSSG